ncbi:C2H2-type zinc finger protein, partial [Herbaspirillum sp. RV1423]|uniref:C2H2-type zinc finger protein n=1 Tax=Herbaspirillum sp. RV1423 TaxID=1443993 RepID=UPI0018CC00BD
MKRNQQPPQHHGKRPSRPSVASRSDELEELDLADLAGLEGTDEASNAREAFSFLSPMSPPSRTSSQQPMAGSSGVSRGALAPFFERDRQAAQSESSRGAMSAQARQGSSSGLRANMPPGTGSFSAPSASAGASPGFDPFLAPASPGPRKDDDLESVMSDDLFRPTNSRAKERRHSCTHCDQSFTTKANLKAHERSRHTNERLHSCSHCDQSFVTKDSLNRHESNMHTGQKLHQCQYCDKSFITAGDRTQHERIHTGERRFKCQYCDKSFFASNDRVKHERTHTGEQPYHCPICGQRFTQKAHLQRHARAYHPDAPTDRSNPALPTTSRNPSLSDLLSDPSTPAPPSVVPSFRDSLFDPASPPPTFDDESDQEDESNRPPGPVPPRDPNVFMALGSPTGKQRGMLAWGRDRALPSNEQSGLSGRKKNLRSGGGQSDSDSDIDTMSDLMDRMSVSGPARTGGNDSAY